MNNMKTPNMKKSDDAGVIGRKSKDLVSAKKVLALTNLGLLFECIYLFVFHIFAVFHPIGKNDPERFCYKQN